MMAISWGDFDSMALNYIRLLASRIHTDPILIKSSDDGPYGVCSYKEYAELVEINGQGRYRPVSTMTSLEFIGLILVRYSDFFQEEEDGVEKKDISAGELFGGEPSAVDAGRDEDSERGRSKDNGGQ